jgi:hypothetical protein
MKQYQDKFEEMQRRIAQIDSLFSDPTEHLLYLYGFLPGGPACRRCGSSHLELMQGNRIGRCLICGRNNYLTAHTFLHGVRRPLDYVRTIFLLEEGFPFSANMYSDITGMAPSSVNSMMAKVFSVVSKFMPKCVSESSSTFIELFHRRSSQTPTMKHPSSEQDIFDDMENEKMAASLDLYLERALNELYELPAVANGDGGEFKPEKEAPVVAATACTNVSSSAACNMVVTTQNLASPFATNKSDQPTETAIPADADSSNATVFDWTREKDIFKALSREPVSFDAVIDMTKLSAAELASALVNLELADLVKCVPGQMYAQKRLLWTDHQTLDKEEKEALFEPFFDFIENTFQGISRKYLQLYLAAHFAIACRKRWDLGQLFSACMRNGRLHGRQRLAYVTPAVVACYVQKNSRCKSISKRN